MDKSKIMLQGAGPHTFKIMSGPNVGEEVDSDSVQWNCPKCGARYNEAGHNCECGKESPYEMVPIPGSTPTKIMGPGPEKRMKQVMHQLRSTPGISKLSSTLDSIADRLETKGLIKEAHEIDKISDEIYAY